MPTEAEDPLGSGLLYCLLLNILVPCPILCDCNMQLAVGVCRAWTDLQIEDDLSTREQPGSAPQSAQGLINLLKM